MLSDTAPCLGVPSLCIDGNCAVDLQIDECWQLGQGKLFDKCARWIAEHQKFIGVWPEKFSRFLGGCGDDEICAHRCASELPQDANCCRQDPCAFVGERVKHDRRQVKSCQPIFKWARLAVEWLQLSVKRRRNNHLQRP